MKNFLLIAIAMIFFMAGTTSADTIATQEVATVSKYVKGKTTLKLSGTLSEAALKALAEEKSSVSICNNLGSYLTVPTLFPESKKGYGTKTGGQKISVKSKNGKFSWTEKDVTANFAFVVGTETVKPDKAALKSSGTIGTTDIDNFKTQKATVLDILAYEKGSDSVAAYTFTPESTGNNFKHANKGADLQVKFSANSKGKASATFKLLPNAASPAFISENYIAPTNLPPVDPPSPVVTNRLYMVIDLSGGPSAESYPISYLNEVPEGGWTEEYKTTKLVLSKINAGKFTMGSPDDELGRDDDEVQHEVTLTKPFFAGVFEVTQKQYELITGNNPANYQGDARPVECVSYNKIRGKDKGAGWPDNNEVDEESFFGILRAKTGLEFDRPTEAQWEFACRAGTTTALNSGKNLSDKSECDEMAEVGRYYYNQNDGKGGYTNAHTTVGSYLPNAWGLYDMHGNVREWCLDWKASYDGDATDPKGEEEGHSRVIRSGFWCIHASCCRSAFRFPQSPGFADSSNGFRVFLTGSNDPPTPPVVTNRLYMVIDLSGGSSAESYPISYLDDVPEGGWTEEYKTTKMVLSKINAGKFTMGSPKDELGRYNDEVQHEVTLTKPFFAGAFEVTQKQYELITGNNPANYQGDARPVEYVSYDMIRGAEKGTNWPAKSEVDATSFFGILRSKTGLSFDLPTEAQWEYACRAGTTTALNSGKNLSDEDQCDEMNEVGRCYGNMNDEKGGYDEHTTVGSYLPNAWGLYDMHGNVWEWCLDWYQSDLGSDPATDPKGNTEGRYRLLRGGGWNFCASDCRSADRGEVTPGEVYGFGGFRVFLVQ